MEHLYEIEERKAPNKTILYIVVPCYNEEEVLSQSSIIIKDTLDNLININKISSQSKILFVNDGSKDNTLNIINELNVQSNSFIGISLSKNFGHQKALLAGLMYAKDYADITISIDADMQDDVNVIENMIDDYYNGNEIVYGVRSSRKTDTFFKRFTATTYYKMLNKLGAKIIYNHADYRLMSKTTLDILENFNETNIFLRGLVPMIGFQSSIVEYERKERLAGESKYPLKKMLQLAFDGITSLSVSPIHFVLKLGITISFISILFLIYLIISYFMIEINIMLYIILFAILFIGGLNLISIGIIGEYIGKNYLETKHRPKFIINKVIKKESNS